MNKKQTNEDKKPLRRFVIDSDLINAAVKSLEDLVDIEYEDENGKKEKVQVKGRSIIGLAKSALLTQPVIPKILIKYLKDMTYIYNTKKTSSLVGRDLEIEKIWFYLSRAIWMPSRSVSSVGLLITPGFSMMVLPACCRMATTWS